MIEIDRLPVPDWGLECPHCAAPLAGLSQHVCDRCNKPFQMLDVLAAHRPIADLGFRCDECDYLLTGLMDERCPECGTEFWLREMIEDQTEMGLAAMVHIPDPSDHYVKKREPTYAGTERPLPDFGLSCGQCAHLLVGATGDTCPGCGAAFDLPALVSDREWSNVTSYIPEKIEMVARMVLYDAQVPYLTSSNSVLAEIYALHDGASLLVSRAFFFDALCAFAEADAPPPAHVDHEWACPNCSETIPAGFEICWSCQTPHPDSP